MALANFIYKGIKTSIQCLNEDKMKNICNKFASKIDQNINTFYFIYNGSKINYDLTFYQNLIENSKKVRKINFKNILKNHKKIKWEHRLHTLCWMMQICEEFAFKRDTYHYACNYFDNYLTFTKDKIKSLIENLYKESNKLFKAK